MGRWSGRETGVNWMGKCLRVNGERNIWIRNQIQGQCGRRRQRLKLPSLLTGYLIPARHDYFHNSHAQPSVARFMAQSFMLTLNLTLYEKKKIIKICKWCAVAPVLQRQSALFQVSGAEKLERERKSHPAQG